MTNSHRSNDKLGINIASNLETYLEDFKNIVIQLWIHCHWIYCYMGSCGWTKGGPFNMYVSQLGAWCYSTDPLWPKCGLWGGEL